MPRQTGYFTRLVEGTRVYAPSENMAISRKYGNFVFFARFIIPEKLPCQLLMGPMRGSMNQSKRACVTSSERILNECYLNCFSNIVKRQCFVRSPSKSVAKVSKQEHQFASYMTATVQRRRSNLRPGRSRRFATLLSETVECKGRLIKEHKTCHNASTPDLPIGVSTRAFPTQVPES